MMKYTTSRIPAGDVISNLRDYDLEFEVRKYSGRGMYGKNCVGFTTDRPHDLLIALVMILKDLSDDATYDDLPYADDLFGNVATDSMGLSSIIYFPGWEFEIYDDFNY
jgi:hypothetical protein